MNKKTIIAVVIIAILLVVGLIIAFQMNKKDKEPVNETNTSETAKTENSTTEEEANTNNKENQTEGEQNMEENTGKYNAVITVKDYGTIEVNLDENAAPITVENFVKLAKEGFYDGLTFHRIISGFMIQGGDPEGTGRGGSDETIKGEFKSNGVENPISHKRGVISMARSNDPDSASSQFFIMHDDGEYLDGNYAAFGHVTSGMDVVDKICENVQPEDPQSGSVAKDKQPVIESIKIEE